MSSTKYIDEHHMIWSVRDFGMLSKGVFKGQEVEATVPIYLPMSRVNTVLRWLTEEGVKSLSWHRGRDNRENLARIEALDKALVDAVERIAKLEGREQDGRCECGCVWEVTTMPEVIKNGPRCPCCGGWPKADKSLFSEELREVPDPCPGCGLSKSQPHNGNTLCHSPEYHSDAPKRRNHNIQDCPHAISPNSGCAECR